VIESRNKTAQRQYRRQSANTAPIPTTQNSKEAKNNQVQSPPQDSFDDLPTDEIDFDLPGATDTPSVTSTNDQSSDAPRGGLAAAIARTREVKQELEKTQRQQQQAQGVRKI
jgi:hypothetical protein